MPLAVYKGGLIVKVEIDENGNEVRKLCTTCCGDQPGDFCCVYKYAIVGTVFGNTAEEAIQVAYDSAVWNVENLYPGQAEPTWGYQKSDGTWTQEAGYDSRFDRYFTNPMWIWNTSSPLYEAPECLPSSDEKCTAPFAFPKDGDCSTDCPDITPSITGACCYFYSASSDESLTQEWRCADGVTEQQCNMTGLNQTFYPGKTCAEIECPPVGPPDCGYCLEYRNSPGNATLTVANNCVTRQWCQNIFDSGQYCEFYPNECMEPGGADQVVNWTGSCGELPCCSHEPLTGRCCVYTGQQFTQGCGDTREECIADAQSEAGSVENGYFDENDITFDPDPDAACPYSVAVYEYLPEADTPVCWDEDEEGNPVTKDFCDALKTPDVFKAEFTDNENCGDDNSGPGTCQSTPNRSNPLP